MARFRHVRRPRLDLGLRHRRRGRSRDRRRRAACIGWQCDGGQRRGRVGRILSPADLRRGGRNQKKNGNSQRIAVGARLAICFGQGGDQHDALA